MVRTLIESFVRNGFTWGRQGWQGATIKEILKFYKMSSDFNFTATSWFLVNVRVKPYFNTRWRSKAPLAPHLTTALWLVNMTGFTPWKKCERMGGLYERDVLYNSHDRGKGQKRYTLITPIPTTETKSGAKSIKFVKHKMSGKYY